MAGRLRDVGARAAQGFAARSAASAAQGRHVEACPTGGQDGRPTTAGLLAEFFPNAKLVKPLESADGPPPPPPYEPQLAHPTESLQKLLLFRGVNPLYGMFLVNQLGVANRQERVQAMESLLELPRSVGRFVRVPRFEEMPPGPLATSRLDMQLLQFGLATAEELAPGADDEERGRYDEDRPCVLALADKLRRLFDYDFPGVHDLYTQPVWAAGEILEFNGDFNKYITSKGMQKQEGVIFRHLLRLILLIAEFQQLCPPTPSPPHGRPNWPRFRPSSRSAAGRLIRPAPRRRWRRRRPWPRSRRWRRRSDGM